MSTKGKIPPLPPPREFPLRFRYAQSFFEIHRSEWRQKLAGSDYTIYSDRFEAVYLETSSGARVVRAERFRPENIGDIERRRWHILEKYHQIGQQRWAKFHEISGDYACYYSYEPVGSRDDDIQHASFFLYRRYLRDGKPSFEEGRWVRPGEGNYRTGEVHEEVQPEVAYEITRMLNRIYWYSAGLQIATHILNQLLTAELYKIREAHTYPIGAKDMAQITINDRHYWYRFEDGVWKRHVFPETERIQLEFK